MTVAILGASGFIGKNLTDYLLKTTDYKILAISRHPDNIFISAKDKKRLTVIGGDITNQTEMVKHLHGVSAAVYLIHALGQKNRDLSQKENETAQAFCQIAKKCGIGRIVYLGGLGNERDKLSEHLASRQSVGRLFKQNLPPVLEFRAPIIIGPGSISFEVIKTLVDKLPVMILPGWAYTLTQPIGLNDVLHYLAEAINIPINQHEIVEIGGPEIMSYKELMLRYARFKGKNLHVFGVSFLPKWPSSLWLYLLIPKKLFNVVKAMIGSLSNNTVVTNNRSAELFYDIKPQPIESSFV